MHRPLRNALVLCLLAAAAAATWYWSRPLTPEPTAAGAGGYTPPGYYLRDAVVMRRDAEGRPLYRIHADFARDRPEHDTLLLDGVRIEYRDEEAIPWRMRAAQAALHGGQRTLELQDGVELVREANEAARRVVIRTERLLLDPDRHFASAPGEVVFTTGSSRLTATGLEAFLKEDRVELESNVHGRYQP